MAIEQGTVVEVHLEPARAFLVSDHAIGAGVLLVDDAFPFNENGGSVQVDDGGPIHDYTDVDMDLNTITLTTTLAAAASTDTPIYVYPTGFAKIAIVDLDDGEEPIRALVPGGQKERWEDGIRDQEAQEVVLVDDSTGRWEIVASDQEEPQLPYIERWLGAAQTVVPIGTGGGAFYHDVLFNTRSDDSTNFSYDSADGSFKIPRAGKYVICGQMTADQDNGDDHQFNVELLAADAIYVWKMPNSGSSDNEVTYVVTRKLDVGDIVRVRLEITLIMAPSDRRLRSGRGKSRISMAWVGE